MRTTTTWAVGIGAVLAGMLPASRAAAQCPAVVNRCVNTPTSTCANGNGCQNAQCQPTACVAKTPNVILFIADDLGWQDLPFFAPPTHWVNAPNTYATAPGPRRVMRPTLNRLEARLAAQPTGTTLPGVGFTTAQLGTSPLLDPALSGGAVVYPLEATSLSGAGAHGYGVDSAAGMPTPPSALYGTDTLRGFGGLRRLAAEGAVFSRFYAVAGYCAPARASIMTGRHKRRTGVQANESPGLEPDEVTIAQYLKHGCDDPVSGLRKPCYTTALIGKWHLGFGPGFDPWERGFDEFIGHEGSHRDYFGDTLKCDPTHPRCTNQTLDLSTLDRDDRKGDFPCKDNDGTTLQFTSTTLVPSDNCRHSVRVYRDLARDFIERHREDAQPFFLVVALNAIKGPHKAPERTERHYETLGVKVPRAKGRGERYWALIEEVDAAVGQLLHHLDQVNDVSGQPLRKNTVVFLTSDHGAPHREYGIPMLRGGKGSSFEGGAQVGLLARNCIAGDPPAPPTPPDLSADVGVHTDLFPTIAEIAGVPVNEPTTGVPYRHIDIGTGPRAIDGRSFYSRLTGGATPHRHAAYYEHGKSNTSERDHASERVCAFFGMGNSLPPNNTQNMPVRGASCIRCDDRQNPTTFCTEQDCTILGKVCCPDAYAIGKECTVPNQQQHLTRCTLQSDCGSGEKCVKGGNVRCNVCGRVDRGFDPTSPPVGRTARWKVRSKTQASAPNCPQADPMDLPGDLILFDLATNLEEDERVNCWERNPTAWIGRACDLYTNLRHWDTCSHWDPMGGEGACEPTTTTSTSSTTTTVP